MAVAAYHPHKPVMVDEVLKLLDPQPGRTYVDVTLGGGGHCRAILRAVGPSGRVIGLDKDPDAIAHAEEWGREYHNLTVLDGDFARLAEALAELRIEAVDGVLFDLGLSSHHLAPGRGFSFQFDEPLDMRFDPRQPICAADVLDTLSVEGMTRMFRDLGDVRSARALARAIAEERATAPITTTRQFAAVIGRVIKHRPRGHIHPATLPFLALRIYVNRELEALERGLDGAIDLLAPGGRVLVISYHSGEDRTVKTKFRQEEKGCICPPAQPICTCGRQPRLAVLTRRPLRPSSSEVFDNPQARSARLRGATRRQSPEGRLAKWGERGEAGTQSACGGCGERTEYPPSDRLGVAGELRTRARTSVGEARAKRGPPAVPATGGASPSPTFCILHSRFLAR